MRKQRRVIHGPSKQEVIEIIKKNPNLTAQEIVKQFNCDISRVHHARSELGLAEKRPYQPRKKAKSVSPRVVSVLRTQVEHLTDANIELAKSAFKKNHQGDLIAELQGVIKYLEKKLEQANGSSV
jgi:hypothetical protein